MPPGSARPSSRAAMFTPSPNRSPPRTITSPTCTPIRNLSVAPQACADQPGEGLLNRNGALDGIHCAGELGQDAITSRVGDPSAMLGNQPVHDLRDRRSGSGGSQPRPAPSGASSLPRQPRRWPPAVARPYPVVGASHSPGSFAVIMIRLAWGHVDDFLRAITEGARRGLKGDFCWASLIQAHRPS